MQVCILICCYHVIRTISKCCKHQLNIAHPAMADSHSAPFNSNEQAKCRVRDYIDTVAGAAFQELSSPNGCPSVTLKRRPKRTSLFINPATGTLDDSGQEASKTYSWPGKDAYEAWKFSTGLEERAGVMLLMAYSCDFSNLCCYFRSYTRRTGDFQKVGLNRVVRVCLMVEGIYTIWTRPVSAHRRLST